MASATGQMDQSEGVLFSLAKGPGWRSRTLGKALLNNNSRVGAILARWISAMIWQGTAKGIAFKRFNVINFANLVNQRLQFYIII